MTTYRIRIYFGKRLGLAEFVRVFRTYGEAVLFCNGLGIEYKLEAC